MRAIILAALFTVAACGDDTIASAPDLAVCAPLTGGNAICPRCAPADGGSCGTEQQGFQCQYTNDYCLCLNGRWTCAGKPFGTPDFAPPHD